MRVTVWKVKKGNVEKIQTCAGTKQEIVKEIVKVINILPFTTLKRNNEKIRFSYGDDPSYRRFTLRTILKNFEYEPAESRYTRHFIHYIIKPNNIGRVTIVEDVFNLAN